MDAAAAKEIMTFNTNTESTMRKSSNPPEEITRSPTNEKPEGTVTADGAHSPRNGANNILVKDPEADDSALQGIKDLDLPDDGRDNQE